MSSPLLLVGWQRGVRRALRAVGSRPVAVLHQRGSAPPAADELDGAVAVDLHGPTEALAAAAAQALHGARPAAVVALAERTVLAAARLRDGFALPGNGAAVALRCADKVAMKRTMDAAGVPVAPWREVRAGDDAGALVEALGLPLVLKPRRDSGGRGQRLLRDAAAVAEALAAIGAAEAGEAADMARGWLAEGWVDGVEMSVESFVHAGEERFANPTAYHVPRHASVLPAALEPEVWDAVRAFAARAVGAAGVERGITHLELFRRGDDLVFGELAIRPPGGRLMTLLQRAWGFDPWEALLRLELGQPFDFPRRERQAAGAWVLHPGAGTLRAVRGLEEARAVPGVRRIALKVSTANGRRPRIPQRRGSGQDVGAIYAEGRDAAAVAAALDGAHERLVFDLE